MLYDTLQCSPEKFRLKMGTRKISTIVFKTRTVESFHTLINVIVNDYHSLPIMFKAKVVTTSLHISNTDVQIEMNDEYLSAPLILTNVLNEPIKYTWDVPEKSGFTIKPIEGTIEINRSIVSEVFYKLEDILKCPKYDKLTLLCEDGATQIIQTTIHEGRLDVCMRLKVINIPNISLNLPFKTYAVILNRSCQPVIFSVRNPKPIKGITISPTQGIIYKKSYKTLDIEILLKSIVSFKCSIEIEIYGKTEPLSFIINGNVNYPRLEFEPKKLQFRKVMTGCFDMNLLTMVNKGKSVVKVDYLQDQTPEYHIKNCYKSNRRIDIHNFLLEPGERLDLAVSYVPLDISLGNFYMPFVINDILGPPEIDTAAQLLSKTYLEANEA